MLRIWEFFEFGCEMGYLYIFLKRGFIVLINFYYIWDFLKDEELLIDKM